VLWGYLGIGFVIRQEAILNDEPAPIGREEGDGLIEGPIALDCVGAG
jgi:hypothetical protein